MGTLSLYTVKAAYPHLWRMFEAVERAKASELEYKSQPWYKPPEQRNEDAKTNPAN